MITSTYYQGNKGVWYVVHEGDDYYLYWHHHGQLPKCLLIVKGNDVFYSLAQAVLTMYGMTFPEASWNDKLIEEIDNILLAGG